MEKLYEHHYKLKSDKLCPFKLGKGERNDANFYNWHENIEIVFVTSDEGSLHYSTEAMDVKRGDIIVINSGVIHRPSPTIEFYYLIIDEGFFKENGFSVSELEFERLIRDDECERLFLSVKEKISEYKSGELHPAELRAAVLALIIYLYNNRLLKKEKNGHSMSNEAGCVKMALAYINERYTEPISLSDIAEVCGVTKAHLARNFKRQTGQTVITYINTLRCKRAAISISEGTSITEAAMECGFESLSYFSRTYKRIIGVAPSTAKNKVKLKRKEDKK